MGGPKDTLAPPVLKVGGPWPGRLPLWRRPCSYGKEAKVTQLTSSLYYKDTTGKLDDANPLSDNANIGLKRDTHSSEKVMRSI